MTRLAVLGVIVSAIGLIPHTVWASTISCGFGGATVVAPCTAVWANDEFRILTDVESGPTNQSAADFSSSASASATFGLDKAFASGGPFGGAEAIAEFLDTMLITGGTGTGTMVIPWSLSGTIEQTPTASCNPANDGSSILLSDPGLSTGGGFAFFVPGACATESLTSITRSGTFTVNFTYGVPFVEGLDVDAAALSGATVDFSHTAQFGTIILPAGATLVTGSGTTYPTAFATVPEPVSLVLVGSGLGFLAKRARRRSPSMHRHPTRLGRQATETQRHVTEGRA